MPDLPAGESETLRLEAFSDGVFSIALTLLIIEIRLPETSHGATGSELLHALAALWPSYLAFVLSFVTVLVMWINHHDLFRLIHRVNRPLLFANGFLLLVVCFVNFPTYVLANHLDEAGANVAAAFYCGTYIAVALSYNLLLHTALPNMRPGVRDGPHSPVPRIRTAYRMGLLVYSTATIVSIFAPIPGLMVCMALWVVWTVLSYRTRPAAAAST